MSHVSNWMVALVVMLAVPLFWKIVPRLWGRVSGPFNEAVKNLLRKTLPYWKGHEQDIKSGVEEVAKEVEQDVDDVSKEQPKQ